MMEEQLEDICDGTVMQLLKSATPIYGDIYFWNNMNKGSFSERIYAQTVFVLAKYLTYLSIPAVLYEFAG